VHAGTAALAALARHDIPGARSAAHTAIARDPLSVEPLFDLAVVDTGAGSLSAARADLQRAVRLQPSNPATWLSLAEFELNKLNDRSAGLRDLGPALYLDPQSMQQANDYLGALRGPPPATNPTSPMPPPASSTSTKTPPGTT
jgi:Tfp pilus assembly protein PilF